MIRKCPVCNGVETTIVRDRVVACVFCGMVYDHQPVSFDYTKLRAYSMAESVPVLTGATMRLLRPWLGKTALEIGCGAGELLAALSRVCKAVGIDQSHAAIRRCLERGLEARQGSVYQHTGDRYDLVVLSHVLEHLEEPVEALSMIASQLSIAGGTLYIEVPDATRHLDHLTVPFQEFSREHINHFSPMLLVRLLGRCGLVVRAMGTRSIPLPSGDLYPALWAVAEYQESQDNQAMDLMLPYLMRLYAEDSERALARMHGRVLRELKGRKCVVWGAGVLAEQLIPRLNGTVEAIVDRDEGKQGSVIAGIRVAPPPAHPDLPILICSIVNAGSIQKDIAELGMTNQVVLLR